LIAGWAPYDTNMKRILGSVSPINKKSETHFILTCHRFN
jgi:hypothetical protein